MKLGPLEINFRNRTTGSVHPSHLGLEQAQYDAWVGGANSKSGVSVTPEGSLRIATVLSCIRLISESIASIPLIVYRRTGKNGRERARNHPLYRVLHDAPNEYQTSFEFRETLQGHLSLRGNAFAFIDWDVAGRVKQLIPMMPDRVGFGKDKASGRLRYSYDQPEGGSREYFEPEEILHLRGLSSDGLVGFSPIDVARESFGLSIATEEYGARFFSNGTHVGSYLETPEVLGDKARENLKRSFRDNHGGLVNAHRMPILEGGLQLKRLNMSTKDAQFIEQRQFQIFEICRIFRVPPHKIYELSRATFSNVESQSIDFVTDSIRPWVSRWEQRLSKSLLRDSEREDYFVEFKLEDLLRGNTKERQEALQIQRRNGVISANEWRAIENMNPREDSGGDTYFEDLSMSKGESTDPNEGDSTAGKNKEREARRQ